MCGSPPAGAWRRPAPRATRWRSPAPAWGVMSLEGDEVKLTSMSQNIRRARALYRAHAVKDQSSDALLEARRLEVARDRVAEGDD